MPPKRKFMKNKEGYSDPTASEALTRIDEDEERFRRFLKLIFSVCDAMGFSLENRITVKDKKTGRIWT